MKNKSFAFVAFGLLGSALFGAPPDLPDSRTSAPSPAVAGSPTGIPENDRLMQEYMARRAEWVQLRNDALIKISQAKTEEERRALRTKLDEDVQLLRTKSAELLRKVELAKKAQAAAATSPSGH